MIVAPSSTSSAAGAGMGLIGFGGVSFLAAAVFHYYSRGKSKALHVLRCTPHINDASNAGEVVVAYNVVDDNGLYCSFDAITAAVDQLNLAVPPLVDPQDPSARKVIRKKIDYYEVVKTFSKKSITTKTTTTNTNKSSADATVADENKATSTTRTEEKIEYKSERKKNRLTEQCTDDKSIVIAVANLMIADEPAMETTKVQLGVDDIYDLFVTSTPKFTPTAPSNNNNNQIAININIGGETRGGAGAPVTLGIETVESTISAGMRIYCQGLLIRNHRDDVFNGGVGWTIKRGEGEGARIVVQKGSRQDYEAALLASASMGEWGRNVSLGIGAALLICGAMKAKLFSATL